MSHSETWDSQPAHQQPNHCFPEKVLRVCLKMGLRRLAQLTRDFLVQGWVAPREEGPILPSAFCGEGPHSRGRNSGSSSLTLGKSPGHSHYSLTVCSLPKLPGPCLGHCTASNPSCPCCQMILLETPVTTLQLFTRTLDAHPSTPTE